MPASTMSISSATAPAVARAASVRNGISLMSTDATPVSDPSSVSRAASYTASNVFGVNTKKIAKAASASVIAGMKAGAYNVPVSRRASRAVGTYVEKVEINQKVITPDEDIYVSAPIAARSAAREIGRLGR